MLFKEVTKLVPLFWTSKLYAFLRDLTRRKNMGVCIYLDVTRDNSIESINGINILYEKNSKLPMLLEIL